MNTITLPLYLFVFFLGLITSERTFADEIKINEVKTNGFTHPGIGLTKDMLDHVRAQVKAKREPWYSSYQKMAKNSNSAKTVEIINQSKTDPTRPNLTKFDNRNIMKQLDYDGTKAYRQALMYYFTGDLTYRKNAMTIIRLWSQMDPHSFASFHSSHIHTPYAVKDLVSAAELMRYTDSSDEKFSWTDQDTDNLTKNLLIPSIDTFMYSNGWFMNQSGYPLAGAMACFIFMNDRESYEKRVEWFTVNKDGPNKGSSSSITDLFRRVEVNAETKKRVQNPFVQLMEMGRDQAHAGGDLEIACNTARMMNAQATKVDPVKGIVSTNRNAIEVYEFLDNRILAAANYYNRFMLGYETPWIPSPSDIEPDGKIKQIYYRLSDNYRGRIRHSDFWDLYYYYTHKKGVNVAKKAPYYFEAFKKRVPNNDFEWLFIPPEASGEGARVLKNEQEPDAVEIVERSTHFGNGTVIQEADDSFLRMKPSVKGSRIAFLSIKTPSKMIGLKIRTSGIATIEMEGFKKPWLLPNTQGQWRYVAYKMSESENVEDIIFAQVKGAPEVTLDLAQFIRKPDNILTPPRFTDGNEPLHINAYVGAPIALDLSAKNSEEIVYTSQDKPSESRLNTESGAYTWSPRKEGNYTFILEASSGKTITPRRISISVAKDRNSAMKAIKSVYGSNTAYTKASLDECIALYKKVAAKIKEADDDLFWKEISTLQKTFHALEILTPKLADGSVDYPQLVVDPDIGSVIGFLIDGNDDTFVDSSFAKDLSYTFDFGSDFKMSFTSFAIEGRVNFDSRTENTVFFGSNDQKEWIELTKPSETSVEMVTMKVFKERQKDQFRYLRAKRTGRKFFEPSELRIYGARHDAE